MALGCKVGFVKTRDGILATDPAKPIPETLASTRLGYANHIGSQRTNFMCDLITRTASLVANKTSFTGVSCGRAVWEIFPSLRAIETSTGKLSSGLRSKARWSSNNDHLEGGC